MHLEIAEQRMQLSDLIGMIKQQSPQIEQLVLVAIGKVRLHDAEKSTATRTFKKKSKWI